MKVGYHYFFHKTKRTDPFASKRFSSPEVEKYQSIVVMGTLIEQRGQEVKIRLTGNGMKSPDPADGEEIVIPIGSALTTEGGWFRSLEDHGYPNCQLGVWE